MSGSSRENKAPPPPAGLRRTLDTEELKVIRAAELHNPGSGFTLFRSRVPNATAADFKQALREFDDFEETRPRPDKK